MAVTYEPIATTTLGSAAASYEFTSIPGTYTDLLLVWSGLASGVTSVGVQYNSDTGSNYSTTHLIGDGDAGSARYSSLTSANVTYGAYPNATNPAVFVLHIMSYANTNVFKTSLQASAAPSRGVDRAVSLWRSTSAITSIKVLAKSSPETFSSGSVFSLYGIKAA